MVWIEVVETCDRGAVEDLWLVLRDEVLRDEVLREEVLLAEP